MNIFYDNIENSTLKNNFYRKVIYTSNHMQIVLMNIPPNDFIHLETHDYIDQFIRIEDGDGIAFVDGKEYKLYNNISIVIPAGSEHKIINTSNSKCLLLYTIYTPPNHKKNKINKTNPDLLKKDDKKNDDNYYNKYLKYKNKYLNEKK